MVGDAVLRSMEALAPLRPLTCAAIAVLVYAGQFHITLHYDSRVLTVTDARELIDDFTGRVRRSADVPATSDAMICDRAKTPNSHRAALASLRQGLLTGGCLPPKALLSYAPMNKTTSILLGTIAVLAGLMSETAIACTSLIVTSNASADGSVFITYTCDGVYHPYLEVIPAGDHEPNSFVAPARWAGRIEGKVRQAAHTYAVLGAESGGLLNDQQVAMAETTFGGREDLHNPTASWTINT